MKKTIALFISLLMLFSLSSLVMATEATAYTQIRFKANTENYGNMIAPDGEVQLTVQGSSDGETWTDIPAENVKFKSLFKIVSVDSNGVAKRAELDYTCVPNQGGGQPARNGIAPVEAYYINPDGSMLTARTTVIPAISVDKTTMYNIYSSKSYSVSGDGIPSLTGNKVISANQITMEHDSGNARFITGNNDNLIYEMWFYDNLDAMPQFMFQDGGGIGSNRSFSFRFVGGTSIYVIENNGDYPTKLDSMLGASKRTQGWHQVLFDLSGMDNNSQRRISCYVDSELVFAIPYTLCANPSMRGEWSIQRISNSNATVYYDNFNLYTVRARGTSHVMDFEVKNGIKKKDENGKVWWDLNRKHDGTNYYAEPIVYYNMYAPGIADYNARSLQTNIYANDGQKSVNVTSKGGQNIALSTISTHVTTPAAGSFVRINIDDAATGYSFQQQFRFTDFYKANRHLRSVAGSSWYDEMYQVQPLLYGYNKVQDWYSDISEEGLLGYSKVKAGLRVMNSNMQNAYSTAVIAAVFEGDKILDVQIGSLNVPMNETNEVTFEFNVTPTKDTQIKLFTWNDISTMSPTTTALKRGDGTAFAAPAVFGAFGEIK